MLKCNPGTWDPGGFADERLVEGDEPQFVQQPWDELRCLQCLQPMMGGRVCPHLSESRAAGRRGDRPDSMASGRLGEQSSLCAWQSGARTESGACAWPGLTERHTEA